MQDGRAKVKNAKVFGDDTSDWAEAAQRFQGNVAYVWHADIFAAFTSRMIEAINFEIRAQIIWKKPRAAISRGHYNWGHEPCWYAVRNGENAAWIGDSKQQTVWEFAAPGKQEDDARVGHPTQKPVGLIARSIANHGGDVYDPFSGSGTAIIAALQMERRAFCVEICPKWCDVAVERWQQYTGGKAQRLKLGIKE
jgi:DNA modification methylase